MDHERAAADLGVPSIFKTRTNGPINKNEYEDVYQQRSFQGKWTVLFTLGQSQVYALDEVYEIRYK